MPSRAETFSVRLTDDVKNQVDEIARVTRRSRSFVIKEAVESYVRERAAYVAELDAAVASAETGVGHSSDQIFGWMRSWGRDDEQLSPSPDIRPED
jgi:predicted transcriptional regulator